MIRRPTRVCSLIAVGLVATVRLWGGGIAAVAGQPTKASMTTSAVPEEFAGLRERWEQAMRDLDVPGLAVIVVRDDKVIYTETLGVRDPQKNLPVTPDTIFYIASCTKSFVAMAVMTLVEEGKVDLDAPVKKYLPRFQIADPNLTETLTVRDLLSHAKGLASGPIVSLDAFSGEITEERFYRWLKEAKARGEFDYTNLHYTLAGRIVESVTGRSWKDFLEERILKPAGMTRTTAYASRMYGDADSALPCALDDGKLVPTRVRKTDRTMHAAGGLGASIKDLGQWLRLNLNRGSIDGRVVLSEDRTVEMWKPHAKLKSPMSRGARTREGYGFGWNVGPFHGTLMMEHGGGYVGTAALIAILPEQRIGVAVVANASVPVTEIAMFDVCNRLLGLNPPDTLPNLKREAERRRQRQTDREKALAASPLAADGLSLPIASYMGAYESPDWGAVTFTAADGRLTARWGELSFRLQSSGKDQFLADSGTGDPDKCRFEVKDRRVEAVVITVDDETKLEARFIRK